MFFIRPLIILMNTATPTLWIKTGLRRPSVKAAKVAFRRARLKCFVALPQLARRTAGASEWRRLIRKKEEKKNNSMLLSLLCLFRCATSRWEDPFRAHNASRITHGAFFLSEPQGRPRPHKGRRHQSTRHVTQSWNSICSHSTPPQTHSHYFLRKWTFYVKC